MHKLIAVLLLGLISLGASATDSVDTAIPGSFAVGVNGDAGTSPVSYSDTVQLPITDAYSRTNTQATVVVTGSKRSQTGSGRGGGYQSTSYLLTVTSATLQAVNVDGSLGASVIMNYSLLTSGVDQWTASAPVPVGNYVLTLAGASSCIHKGGSNLFQCAPSATYFVRTTETSDALAAIYYWTDHLSAVIQQAPYNLVLDPTNAVIYPGDLSGPQQVCDLYNWQFAVALQAILDSQALGVWQVDNVTSSPIASSPGAGTCAYTLYFQDVINAPGVEMTDVIDVGGNVFYTSGASLHQPPGSDGNDD